MIHFEFPTDEAERLATALAAVLDEPGWYTNFDVDGDKVVIFGEAPAHAGGDHVACRTARTHASHLLIGSPPYPSAKLNIDR